MATKRNNNLKEEASAFDAQILERVRHGHIPDLRRAGRCEYFYNNVWRDQRMASLYFGELVERVAGAIKKYYTPDKNKKIRILEVGCGPGHVSLELSRNGFNVTGIDLSSACIEIARKTADDDPWKNKRTGLTYIQENFLDHEGKYDVVLFTASLHHFRDTDKIVRRANKILVSGGLIIADEPTRDRVSRRNASVILMIKGILSAAGAYFRDFALPQTAKELDVQIDKIIQEEKYQTEDGTKIQSINDNESGYKEMLSSLITHFQQLELKEDYAIFHQLVGGIRLDRPEKEIALAKFLKLIDVNLCRNNAIDPINFYFVGKKK